MMFLLEKGEKHKKVYLDYCDKDYKVPGINTVEKSSTLHR